MADGRSFAFVRSHDRHKRPWPADFLSCVIFNMVPLHKLFNLTQEPIEAWEVWKFFSFDGFLNCLWIWQLDFDSLVGFFFCRSF